MFERRENEPEYALLRTIEAQQLNQYGDPIETVKEQSNLRGQSLNINQDAGIGENPNRYKQHGFYFNADNCIACHACESACSEKNDLPPHLAFRSVGFVEGGTYPAYQRLNISMACNHCDDPVCLKGCPTRAYTKFAEYGAVLQDPDICFGCGYCTWVCPYNAPQLDPVEGQVSKCNMCVDRLEVGLKPACVSACLGNALDFGVVEDIPENRSQAKTQIPGFPRTDITHPNIRFQQTRTPPERDMHRVDQMALKYHRKEGSEEFVPELDPKQGFKREWNLKKLLGSHENAHIAFTLSSQAIIGAFLLFLLAGFQPALDFVTSAAVATPALITMLVTLSFGLFKLNMHLGKPHRFYRGFYNLRLSPVSREIAGISAFFTGLIGYALFYFINIPALQLLQQAIAVLAVLGAGFGGYFMYKLYRIKARPFWDHWHTGASFIASGLYLGAGLLALISLLVVEAEVSILLGLMLAGFTLESIALIAHANSNKQVKSEAAASFYLQQTQYGKAYRLRNALLPVLMISALLMIISKQTGLAFFIPLLLVSLLVALIGRALFYVAVIPTTMPGAFFWRNQGFVEHARDTGLANMPQLGVAYERHHKFKLDELIETIKTTSMQEKWLQLKNIVMLNQQR